MSRNESVNLLYVGARIAWRRPNISICLAVRANHFTPPMATTNLPNAEICSFRPAKCISNFFLRVSARADHFRSKVCIRATTGRDRLEMMESMISPGDFDDWLNLLARARVNYMLIWCNSTPPGGLVHQISVLRLLINVGSPVQSACTGRGAPSLQG